VCPAGLGPVSDCAGEGRQRLWAADPSSGRGGAPHRRARDCLTVVKVWSWAPDVCFDPGRTGRVTVSRNMRLDSTSSRLHGNEYERRKWRHCWCWWFVFGPPRIYATSHSKLALQGVEAGSNHLHRSLASRKGRRKGNPVPGV
jgi:hypothetical protein